MSTRISDASTILPVDAPDFTSFVERGLKYVDVGRTISHEELKDLLAQSRQPAGR